MLKTSLSNSGGVGSIPGQGAKISHALWPKNQSIKQKHVVTNSKTFKMVHIKRILKKKIMACQISAMEKNKKEKENRECWIVERMGSYSVLNKVVSKSPTEKVTFKKDL